MPILREDQEKRTGRRGRRWLWLLVVPPVLLLSLLVAGTIRPIVLQFGEHWLFVGGEWAVQPRPEPRPLLGMWSFRPGIGQLMLGGPETWWTEDGWTGYLRVGRWCYGTGWWRGRRAPDSASE